MALESAHIRSGGRALLKEGIGEVHVHAAGDRLDVGVEAFPGQKPNDTVLLIESRRTIVAGDTLVDFGRGLEVNPRWLRPDMTWQQVVDGLRPLLEKPVEHARSPSPRRPRDSCRLRQSTKERDRTEDGEDDQRQSYRLVRQTLSLLALTDRARERRKRGEQFQVIHPLSQLPQAREKWPHVRTTIVATSSIRDPSC
jgi:hypothetical protein